MKRALKSLALLWALGLVGWAVAAAQGWVAGDQPEALPASAGEPTPPDALPAPADTRPALVHDLPRPVDELPEEPALFPSTKADSMGGSGGLTPLRRTPIGSGGLGGRGRIEPAAPEAAPKPEATDP